MKKFLTEKNLMWVAIAVLAVLQLCPSLGVGKPDGRPDAMRQRMNRMEQVRDHSGSRGDTGRGEWTEHRLVRDRAKGKSKKPKDSE